MEQSISPKRPAEPHATDVRLYLIPCLLLAFFLTIVTLVSVVQTHGLLLSHSALLNVSITSAAVVIALGVAYFSLTEFLLYGFLSALLVTLAFMMMAASDLVDGLIPVLAGWHPGTGQVNVHWSADLCWAICRTGAAAVLVVAALVPGTTIRRVDRTSWIVLGTIAVLGAAGTVTLTSFEHAGDTPREVLIFVNALGSMLCLAASVLFWQAAKTTGRTWFIWLSLNLGIGTFAELQYVFHPFQATVVQPGDVLRLAFSAGILLGLIGEWGRGFRALRSQTRQLEVMHALMTAPEIRNLRQVVSHATAVISEALNCQTHILLPSAPPEAGAEVAELVPDQSTGGESSGVVSFDEAETGRTGLVTDLEADGRHLGTLMVTRTGAFPYSYADTEVFRALSSQTALLIERSLLYEEVAAGAVLEERSRLAREIHDGLAQHLAFLKMRVAFLQRSPAAVEIKQLRDIEGVLTTALAEARQAISTLRSDSGATTTAEALTQFVNEFGQLSSLEVTLESDEQLPEVGPKVRVELQRIVQESLNNVRKHAGATKVSVRLSSSEGRFLVRIHDNGKGFDPNRTPEGHFGVAIMRERAESVGGTFTLSSVPGEGSSVEVAVPVPNVDDRLIG
jgi:signal transduction histidine kinase